jgi:signal transduction histidine kinase
MSTKLSAGRIRSIPFRRGHEDGQSSKTEGLGLRLYISNEVVKAHGGRIEVRSNLAEGTTFCVLLPLEPRPTVP